MPGIGQDQSKEGAVPIPVTTGEITGNPVTSTVPERDAVAEAAPFQDIRPPVQESGQTVQVQVQGEATADSNLKEAIGNLDKVANQPAPTGLEFKEENAGQPVNIVGDPTRQAVDQSLQGKNPHELEALVSADGEEEEGQIVEPAAVEIAQPVAEPKPEPPEPPVQKPAAPVPPKPVEPEPVVPSATEETLAPTPQAPPTEPVVPPTVRTGEPVQLAEIAPDQGPYVDRTLEDSQRELDNRPELQEMSLEEARVLSSYYKDLADKYRGEYEKKASTDPLGAIRSLNYASSAQKFYGLLLDLIVIKEHEKNQTESGPASGGAK